MTGPTIIPAILAYDAGEFREKILLVEHLVSRVQIDVVGADFSSQVSVEIERLGFLPGDVSYDVQLMVREPVGFLGRCESAGVDRVFGHVEYMESPPDFIEHASFLDMQVGLAVDLSTPVGRIAPFVGSLDAILVMAVRAGRSGQTFDPQVLPKIASVRKMREDLPICVDGGITVETIRPCIEEGATEFAVGAFLWESKDISKTLAALSMEAR